MSYSISFSAEKYGRMGIRSEIPFLQSVHNSAHKPIYTFGESSYSSGRQNWHLVWYEGLQMNLRKTKAQMLFALTCYTVSASKQFIAFFFNLSFSPISRSITPVIRNEQWQCSAMRLCLVQYFWCCVVIVLTFFTLTNKTINRFGFTCTFW